MHFTCDCNTFVNAFQIVARVAGKSSRPGLAYVKAEMNEDVLTLSGTDLEQTIVKRVFIQGVQNGVALLPKVKFSDILGTIDEPITVHEKDFKIKVTSGRSSWNVLSNDPNEFPECGFRNLESPVVVSANDFDALFKRTQYAADNSKNGVAMLSGVLVECENGSIGFTGIDGRRLSHQEIAVDNEEASFQVICPMDSLRTVSGIIKDEPISIWSDGNRIWFQTETLSIESGVLEGNFPVWKNFMPQCNRSFGVIIKPFVRAISQAAIMKNDESKAVSFNFSEGSCLMSGSHFAGDSMIPCEAGWVGDDDSFRVDPNYVMECLKFLGLETVNIKVEDNGRAWVVETDDGFYGFIMLIGDRT